MNKIALLFSGQGSQYTGMASNVCKLNQEAKKLYEEASDILGFDLYKLCEDDSAEELVKTENQQPAILTASYAYYQFFMNSFGVKPAFLAGHSLGEISALTCSGAIAFQDAVRIVRKRGELMRDAVTGKETGMLAIMNTPKDIIEELCEKERLSGEVAAISNYNSPKQIVVSGTKKAMNEIQNAVASQGQRAVPLKVSAPFHSVLMTPAAEEFAEFLKSFTFQEMQYPVLSDVTALPYTGKDAIVEMLRQQMVQAVQWEKIMDYFKTEGVDGTIELGPKKVLKKLSEANVDSISAYAFDLAGDRKDLTEQLLGEGKSIELQPMLFVTRCMAHAVCTPNTNWDEEQYQKGVTEPYKRIKAMQEKLEEEGKEPTKEQLREAFSMLESVFATKHVSEEERESRINSLFDETGARTVFSDIQIRKEN